MNTYPIPDTLEAKYKGAGYGLAATVDGKIVDIAYLSDLLPDFDGDIETAMNDDRLGPTVRYLSGLGSVHAGMLSGWTFTEL